MSTNVWIVVDLDRVHNALAAEGVSACWALDAGADEGGFTTALTACVTSWLSYGDRPGNGHVRDFIPPSS